MMVHSLKSKWDSVHTEIYQIKSDTSKLNTD